MAASADTVDSMHSERTGCTPHETVEDCDIDRCTSCQDRLAYPHVIKTHRPAHARRAGTAPGTASTAARGRSTRTRPVTNFHSATLASPGPSPTAIHLIGHNITGRNRSGLLATGRTLHA